MEKSYIPFDWKNIDDKSQWLDPCEESYYYAEKWKREGRHSILDLGCGLGRHSILFAKYGFKVTAMDCSTEALDFLKNYRREQKVDFTIKRADMEKMPFVSKVVINVVLKRWFIVVESLIRVKKIIAKR